MVSNQLSEVLIVRTLTATATVSPDHTLMVQVPEDIPPGTHQVIVVLPDGVSGPPSKPFAADWPPPYDTGPADPNMTFRREDFPELAAELESAK